MPVNPRRALLRIVAGGLALFSAVPGIERAALAQSPDCAAPAELTRLGAALPRLKARLKRGEPVKIVAIGSSSTSGYGASGVDTTYPSRLAARLRALFPQSTIEVLNSGRPGASYRAMLDRLDSHVLGHGPDLVLWQVGTIDLLREDGIAHIEPHLREGVRRIRAAGADAVLIDPQYAPRVLRDPDAEPMVALLARVARTEDTGLFRRFALMRYWQETRNIPFETMLRHDMFHLNDWSYGCWAEHLANAITAAVGPTRAEAVEERKRAGSPTALRAPTRRELAR